MACRSSGVPRGPPPHHDTKPGVTSARSAESLPLPGSTARIDRCHSTAEHKTRPAHRTSADPSALDGSLRNVDVETRPEERHSVGFQQPARGLPGHDQRRSSGGRSLHMHFAAAQIAVGAARTAGRPGRGLAPDRRSRSSSGRGTLPIRGRGQCAWPLQPPGGAAGQSGLADGACDIMRRRCRWRAGPSCLGPGRTSSWSADQHGMRPPGRSLAAPRRPVRR
jgi:hypothetical protein